MLVMLGLAGLGMESGHLMLQNTRLQNSLDAAALSGAKTLAQTNGNTTEANTDVLTTFANNADNVGNTILNSSYLGGQMNVNVEFSNTLLPFAAGTTPARYVRVSATNFRVPGFLIPLLGFMDIPIASTAVAGPSPSLTETVCNLAPMMVCGDPVAAQNGDPFMGYTPGAPDVLKTSTTGGDWEVGPGNFQLIRLDGNSGAADVRTALAGDFNACVNLNDTAQTEPGNTVGPVVQGLNTRFGMYQGPMGNSQDQYPPDVIVKHANYNLGGNHDLAYDASTDQISYNGNVITSADDMTAQGLYHHEDYIADLNQSIYDNQPLDGSPAGPGAFGRRTIAMPVGDCSVTQNGAGTLPLMGVLCFHLLQPVEKQGNLSHVYGQVIDDGCGVTGNPGEEPNDEAGPFIIQLYKDPDTNAT
jgi:Flp pilus assembly protein TadG